MWMRFCLKPLQPAITQGILHAFGGQTFYGQRFGDPFRVDEEMSPRRFLTRTCRQSRRVLVFVIIVGGVVVRRLRLHLGSMGRASSLSQTTHVLQSPVKRNIGLRFTVCLLKLYKLSAFIIFTELYIYYFNFIE